VVITVVMIVTIMLVEDVRGFSAIFDVLILGVALAVAAVPNVQFSLTVTKCKLLKINGGADGTRTRDLRRDRPAF
jgi:hypothetical protein